MSPAEMDCDKMEAVEAADECTASGGGGGADNTTKACADCNTTKTPLWRGGPTGPKSLCNACGIRYRKRRRVAMGLDPEVKRKPKRDAAPAAINEAKPSQEKDNEEKDEEDSTKAASASATNTKAGNKTQTVELHMVGFAKDAVLKQRRRMRRSRSRKPSCLGEEERAAILLMALSSGVIYA